jgi:hypothetical protein
MKHLQERILVNLIPRYRKLFIKSNVLLYILKFYDFDPRTPISNSFFGKNISGENIRIISVSLNYIVHNIFIILKALVNENYLQGNQIILILDGVIQNEDGSLTPQKLEIKFKIKEQFESYITTKDLTFLKLIQKYSLSVNTLFRPEKIEIKILLNTPYDQISKVYIDDSIEKINLIRNIEKHFLETLLPDIIIYKNIYYTDFDELQKKYISILTKKDE